MDDVTARLLAARRGGTFDGWLVCADCSSMRWDKATGTGVPPKSGVCSCCGGAWPRRSTMRRRTCGRSIAMGECPRFVDAPDIVRAEVEFAPMCAGDWTAGSGGHRVHATSCGAEATWWSPQDTYAYCDAHVPDIDRTMYRRDWADIRSGKWKPL